MLRGIQYTNIVINSFVPSELEGRHVSLTSALTYCTHAHTQKRTVMYTVYSWPTCKLALSPNFELAAH